jgi:hypothetical protein
MYIEYLKQRIEFLYFPSYFLFYFILFYFILFYLFILFLFFFFFDKEALAQGPGSAAEMPDFF